MPAEKDVVKPDVVPTYVYDAQVAYATHQNHIHWCAHAAMLLAILIIVGAFIWYLYQYDYVSNETVTIDGADGIANYIGKDGNIYNGESSGEAYPLTHEEGRGQ